MSGLLKVGGKFALPKPGSLLSRAGNAGPRRLVMILLAGTAIATVVGVVIMSGQRAPTFSRDARMKSIDALPGGLHSSPEMGAVAHVADTASAQAALTNGVSFTPPIAP